MARMFGTDGVRGIANTQLTGELAYKLGQAGAKVLEHGNKTRILVAKDTRLSGDMLGSAITAGICSMGAEAVQVGVLPTPAVAYLVRLYEMDAGVMISASHNSFEYNGIKFFDKNGLKLPDSVEDEMQAIVESGEGLEMPIGAELGRSVIMRSARQDYIDFLVECADTRLDNLEMILDCSNGSASTIACEVFRRLGANVTTINDQPDGMNINDHCGSTHPENLQRRVMNSGAEIGLAFDGDADRLIAVDEKGNLVDGDHVMAICGIDLKQQGRLRNDAVIGTVMSNMGLEKCLQDHGIKLERTKVGDRYVLEHMLASNDTLGGEQSGHIIFKDYNTTGDGILSGIMLCCVMMRSGKRLSQLSDVMQDYPQVLINVKVTPQRAASYKDDPKVAQAIADAEATLGDTGRVLIRPSGTEPLVRVMLEGSDQNVIYKLAKTIAKAVEQG